MADIIFLVLLIVHVGAIIGWMGGAILFVSVVGPSLGKMNPSSRSDFMLSVLPRFSKYVAVNAVTAIVGGVLLYGYVTQVATSLAPSGAALTFLDAGAVVGLIAFILAFAVVLPTTGKILKALRQMPQASGQTPQGVPSVQNPMLGELMRLQKRLRGSSGAVAGLLVLILILMVVGTNI